MDKDHPTTSSQKNNDESTDEEIIEDYAHSSALIRDAFKDWLPPAGTPVIDPSVRERMFASDPEDMEATLQYIRGRWGSARGYMLDLGISPELIARLRHRVAV